MIYSELIYRKANYSYFYFELFLYFYKKFDCGNDSFDRYLKKQISNNPNI